MLAVACSSVAAWGADMKLVTKAPQPAPAANPWDFAFGSALMSDYNFRGITQSNHKPSVAAYFEPRYNITDTLQAYVGVSGESISFPNRAAAEIDFYGGIRPTYGKLALDFGFWEYYYPGGQCFNDLPVGGPNCAAQGFLPNGNVMKADVSFWEVYGKATYTVNDNFTFGGSAFYSPSVLNSGADGTYAAATAKYTVPNAPLPAGVGVFISADIGHWFLGTSDSFYCTQVAGVCGGAFPTGIPYKSYTNWDAGLGVHLQGVHARSAILRHQPEQGRLQRLHQRSHRDRDCDDADQSVRRSGLELVRRELHREAVGRHDRCGEPQMSDERDPAVDRRDRAIPRRAGRRRDPSGGVLH